MRYRFVREHRVVWPIGVKGGYRSRPAVTGADADGIADLAPAD